MPKLFYLLTDYRKASDEDLENLRKSKSPGKLLAALHNAEKQISARQSKDIEVNYEEYCDLVDELEPMFNFAAKVVSISSRTWKDSHKFPIAPVQVARGV